MTVAIYIVIRDMFITHDALQQTCMRLRAVIAFFILMLCTTTVMAETKPLEKKNPIIFIPGIMGSRLYDPEGNLVWIEYSLKLTKLGEGMRMQNALIVKNNEIDQVTVPVNEREYGAMGPIGYPYKKIIDLLCNEFPDRGMYFFSYDFRQSKSNSSDLLHQQIQNILQKTGGSKVDIIAHSLGGLVLATYLETYGGEHIRKIITAATPYEGTPDTINTALTGELTYVPAGWLEAVTKLTREVRTSFPSSTELIPTNAYDDLHPAYLYTGNVPANDEIHETEITFLEGDPYYTPAGLTKDAGLNVYKPLTGSQYELILRKIFGDEHPLRLENDSRIITTIDNSYFAVGINHQTIRSLIFSDDLSDPRVTHVIYDHEGDGCVPKGSATMHGYLETLGKDAQGNERLLKVEAEHGGITSHNKARDWIVAVLSDKSTESILSDPAITDKSIIVKTAGHHEIVSKLHNLVTSIKNQKNT